MTPLARAWGPSLLTALVVSGCDGGRVSRSSFQPTGGDPERGEAAIVSYGCGACHDIPGVRAARGQLGPPLGGFARRTFIAGTLPNAPDNLVRWIRDPRAVRPHTAMPQLGLTEPEARDVAAYLYSLD